MKERHFDHLSGILLRCWNSRFEFHLRQRESEWEKAYASLSLSLIPFITFDLADLVQDAAPRVDFRRMFATYNICMHAWVVWEPKQKKQYDIGKTYFYFESNSLFLLHFCVVKVKKKIITLKRILTFIQI